MTLASPFRYSPSWTSEALQLEAEVPEEDSGGREGVTTILARRTEA